MKYQKRQQTVIYQGGIIKIFFINTRRPHLKSTFFNIYIKLMLHVELEVVLVEFVHPDETVLSSTGKPGAVGVELDRVYGSEVPLDPGKFVLENHVEEAGVEFSVLGRSGRYVPGLLTSS